MPDRSEIEEVELVGWVGGLNREADPYQLELNETPDALNVDFGLKGDVSKRDGYVEEASHTEVIQALLTFPATTDMVGISIDGDILEVSGGVITDSLLNIINHGGTPRGYPIASAALSGFLYFTRCEAVVPNSWDGATVANVTATAFDGTSGTFPRARTLTAAHNRMFAGNVIHADDTAHPSRLHFSNPLDPETWSANDWFDIAPDNGQEITSTFLFGDQIIVFKERSIFTFVGTDATEFAVFPLDEQIGTSNTDTVANLGLRLLFFDHHTGVWMFDGVDFSQVSEKINTYLLDGVNADEVYKAFAWTHRNKYYLSVPWGTDTVNSRTFVYDPRVEAWTEYDFGVSSAAPQATEVFAVGTNNETGVQELFQGITDNGANINAFVKTAWVSPATPSHQHRLRRLDVIASALGDHDITVRSRRDFSQSAHKVKTFNTLDTGADEVQVGLTGWGGRWRAIQFEISEATDGTFQVNRVIMLVSALERSRGAIS